MDHLKTKLLNHRLAEIELREKILADLRTLDLSHRTARVFCEKELGYSTLETKSILSQLGLILMSEDLISADVHVQSRIDRLREWRRERAGREGVPAYRVLTNRELMQIASENPNTPERLRDLKGFGIKRTEVYGPELIALFNT